MTPPPHRAASVYPPAFGAGGGHTRWVEWGWGVNILEDARHISVLYICKYFVRGVLVVLVTISTKRVQYWYCCVQKGEC
jgi:hypothetical protein